MHLRFVKMIPQDELHKLSTQRVLAYLRKLQKCEESPELSDWTEEEISQVDGIIFKSSEEWKEQYNLVKEILSERENVGNNTGY